MKKYIDYEINVNGYKIHNYIESETQLILFKEDIQDTTPIKSGLIHNAYYCRYKGGFKWKLELKKHLARILKLPIHVAWCDTREEVIGRIEVTNKLITK